MRLGVVLTGAGVHGAAGAGVLMELWRRQMEPYAVCGLHAGAWPAALYAAGADENGFNQALAQAQGLGTRLLKRRLIPSMRSGPMRTLLSGSAALERLLTAHTGGRILALCDRRVVIPVRCMRTGQHLAFSSAGFTAGEGTLVTMQASAAFSARAAMGLPPFLSPVSFMGSRLLPVSDTAYACRLLFAMGVQRVLVVEGMPSVRSEPDMLDLAAACFTGNGQDLPEGAVRLRIPFPEGVGALALNQVQRCAQAGQKTAELELDRLFETMGMAFCRVLPFQKRALSGPR